MAVVALSQYRRKFTLRAYTFVSCPQFYPVVDVQDAVISSSSYSCVRKPDIRKPGSHGGKIIVYSRTGEISAVSEKAVAGTSGTVGEEMNKQMSRLELEVVALRTEMRGHARSRAVTVKILEEDPRHVPEEYQEIQAGCAVSIPY